MATKPKDAKAPAQEGLPVDLGDCSKGLYRDKSGQKLGGGPSEGASYSGVVAENARQSVEDFHKPAA